MYTIWLLTICLTLSLTLLFFYADNAKYISTISSFDDSQLMQSDLDTISMELMLKPNHFWAKNNFINNNKMI